MKKKTKIKIKSIMLLVIFVFNLSFEISMNSSLFSNSVEENSQIDQINEIPEMDIEFKDIPLLPKEMESLTIAGYRFPLPP